jgi:hypothetical protein
MSFPLTPANNQVTLENGIAYTYNASRGAWYRTPATALTSLTSNTFTVLNSIIFSDGTSQTTAANPTDAYARTTANTATDNITILQGVNETQNTRITSADNTATASYTKANAAFDQANTDFTTITVTSGVYGNATFVPVITLGANGRVIAVTNTAISSGGGGGATITDDTTSSGTRYITMTTQTSGSQSIANTSTTKLFFQPSTGTLSSTIFSSLSDETKKTNINVISNSLNVTENIRGVTFDWTDGTGSSAGLIAQDVEKYLPQLVHIDEFNGTKALNYNGVIGVLVEAVKELSERVKQLESK